MCPQQQAFDAFAAAPGATSSVSHGVFFRMEGAHSDCTLNGLLSSGASLIQRSGSIINNDGVLPANGSSIEVQFPQGALALSVTINIPASSATGAFSYILQTTETPPTVLATITGTNAGAALSETIALTPGPFFMGTLARAQLKLTDTERRTTTVAVNALLLNYVGG